MHELFSIVNSCIRKMFKDSFTTDGAGDTAIRVTGELTANIDEANTEQVLKVSLASTATEYPVSLPTNTKRYTIFCRDRKKVLLGFNSGDIASDDYVTILPGELHDSNDLDYVSSTDIYLNPSSNNIDVEIHIQRKL